MEIFITDEGSPKFVASKLEAAAKQGVDTMAVMTEILLDVIRITQINFTSQGRRGGGSWAALKPGTVRKKGVSIILRTIGAFDNYDDFGPDELLRSVTKPGSAYNITEITNDGFEFGTEHPAAEAMQRGVPKRNVPARPFVKIIPSDVRRWDDMIVRHLMRPLKIDESAA